MLTKEQRKELNDDMRKLSQRYGFVGSSVIFLGKDSFHLDAGGFDTRMANLAIAFSETMGAMIEAFNHYMKLEADAATLEEEKSKLVAVPGEGGNDDNDTK